MPVERVIEPSAIYLYTYMLMVNISEWELSSVPRNQKCSLCGIISHFCNKNQKYCISGINYIVADIITEIETWQRGDEMNKIHVISPDQPEECGPHHSLRKFQQESRRACGTAVNGVVIHLN